jgi:hypothetical protein
MKVYRPKYLIGGDKIDAPKDTNWVAVPEKYRGEPFRVEYGATSMLIKDWLKDAVMIKTFADKFATPSNGRPKYYRLGYFQFVPDRVEVN